MIYANSNVAPAQQAGVVKGKQGWLEFRIMAGGDGCRAFEIGHIFYSDILFRSDGAARPAPDTLHDNTKPGAAYL